jgi:hypothetical protein
MTFRVGQKVVCVNDEPGYVIKVDWLIRGRVYTIRRIDEMAGGLGLSFYELPDFQKCKKSGWAANRFRPIAERKTDISIFTAMLNPSKQGVEA